MRRIAPKHPTLAARFLPSFVLAMLVAGAVLCGTRAADAASTPAQKCEAGKNKAAGKFAACRQNAEAALATKGDVAKHDKAVAACAASFLGTWLKLEAKAGATCRDGAGSGNAFEKVIAGHSTNIATALTGGALGDLAECQNDLTVAQRCGNGNVESPEQCDGSNLASQTCVTKGFVAGTLRCASGCTFDTSGCFASRFVDNGNGTVTDHETGLQWEQKDGVGGGADLANPHDVDNTYTWTAVFFGKTPNGTAFTDFLLRLNGASFDRVTLTGCFAGHCDWRLPTVVELQTILLHSFPCTTSPCIDPVFGPTVANFFWSATPRGFPSQDAYRVSFGNGYVTTNFMSFNHYVRAVRAGL